MSNSALQTNVNVEQLTRNIREQIRRTSRFLPDRTAQDTAAPSVPSQLLESLKSIDRELHALAAQEEIGEPAPATLSWRQRIGVLLKRRLYRLLWWQTHQIKALTSLVARGASDQVKAIAALAEHANGQGAAASLHQSIAECRQQVHDYETRLRQLESAQLRLQAAAIERNVKERTELETALASLRREISDAVAIQQRAIAQQQQALAELATRVHGEAAEREQLAARLSEFGLFTHQTRSALTLHDRRLTVFIEEARKRLPESFTAEQVRQIVSEHNDHKYDSVYVAFEDVFRGSREEIKARQSIYLPLLKENNIGSAERPILDLGCGRGEWLELLREHDLTASGVDRNGTMVEYCQSAGLHVTQSDVLPYMSALPDSSLGAITSFHMVEHLPFDTVLRLVDEALRLLRPGGILILETPNPQNVLVGATAFHFDPSHLKPLPSPMLRFFVEARGFCDVHVRELHPYPDAVLFPDDGKGIASRLNQYFYGPQDYAVIGRKP